MQKKESITINIGNYCKTLTYYYRAFHRIGQAKFLYDGSVLGSSQFSILPQLPPKMMLNSKVVKIDPKIIISLRYII